MTSNGISLKNPNFLRAVRGSSWLGKFELNFGKTISQERCIREAYGLSERFIFSNLIQYQKVEPQKNLFDWFICRILPILQTNLIGFRVWVGVLFL